MAAGSGREACTPDFYYSNIPAKGTQAWVWVPIECNSFFEELLLPLRAA